MVCCRWSMTCRISLGFTRQLLDPEWSGSALKEFAFALSSCKRVCLCLLVQGTTLGLGFSGASIAADCSVCLVACRNSGRLRGSVICPLLAPARHTTILYRRCHRAQASSGTSTSKCCGSPPDRRVGVENTFPLQTLTLSFPPSPSFSAVPFLYDYVHRL